jgi:putative inorganic carbon (HCO3(-)) transporter
MCVALVAAPILVLGDVWDEPRVEDFRTSPGQIGVAIVVGAAALAALLLLFRRWPEAFPIAAFALLPIRVPVEIGGETANLLVPLYLVIAAQVIRLVTQRTDGASASPRAPTPWTQYLKYLLAATLVVYAIQASYSEDVSNAIENIGFFLVPFGVLFVLLTEVRWTRRLLEYVLVAVGAVAVAVAGIALYQYVARDLFLNPELFDANQLHLYFRVNSIFYDPNILGRYLALAITALAAYLAWSEYGRGPLAAALACAIALAGLALSYSITSFVAVLAGLGIVALLRWSWRGALAAGAFATVALVVFLMVGGTPSSDIQSDREIDAGRSDLIEGGIDLAQDRPAGGWGSGSFGAAFVSEIDEKARSAISHSEPITVGAEQGAVGLVVYVAFVAVALITVLGGGAGGSVARTAVAACFVAMLVHSLGYAGFAIDPVVWALLGLGVALRRDPPEASATIPS